MPLFPARVHPSATLFKLTLLGLPLLLAACSNSGTTPAAPEATLTSPAFGAPAATLEAEEGQTLVLPGADLSAQATVEPGAPTGGQTISDPKASGGQAVSLFSTGSAVRFTVPTGTPTGNYTVRVRGRGVVYNGNPIVALQLNGMEKGRVELTTTSYSSFTVGTFSLKAGDVLTVVFTNDAYGGSPSKDRNAVVDHLILDPAGTGTTSGAAVKVDAAPGAGAGASGSYVTLLGNGATANLTVPAGVSGTYRLQLQAKGDVFQGEPVVEVRKSGTVLGKVTVGATAGLYDAGTLTVQPGDVLNVVFVNDYATGPWPNDRNALIDYGVFVPVATPSPAPTASSLRVEAETIANAGAEVRTDDPAASGGYAALLGAGAGVVWTVPSTLAAGTYALTAQAREQAYQGDAVLSLVKNGQTVTTKTVTSGSFAPLELGSLSLTPGDRVEVLFTNDLYGGGGNDRNAYLDHLTVTPTTAPATAPTAAASPTPPTGTPPTGTDVRTFGAKGDGSTDDTAALQRAADSRQNLSFPAGTYVVSKPVVWGATSGQVITGDPGALIKISGAWNNGGAHFGALTFKNPTNLTVKSLAFKGFTNLGDTWGSARQEGIQVDGGSNVTFDGISMDSVHSFGINGDNVNGYKVTGSRLTYIHGTGIGCGNCTNVVVSGNTVTGTADPNTPIDQGNNTSGIGIFLQNGSGALIENNVIKNQWDTATKTEGMSNVTYRGNTVDTFGKDGIKIMFLPAAQGGTGQAVTNGVIENNVIRNFKGWRWDGGGGYVMAGVVGGRLSNNVLYGTPGLAKESGGIGLANFMDQGVQSRDLVVEDNKIYDVSRGLLVKTTNATIVRRNLFANSAASVKNMRRCVDLESGNGTVLEDNTFEGFTDICVLPYNSIDNVTVQRNAYKNGQAGLWMDANDSTGFKVLSNSFENVPEPLPYQGTVAQCSGNTGTGVRSECR